jgi:hypothetical protein
LSLGLLIQCYHCFMDFYLIIDGQVTFVNSRITGTKVMGEQG